MLAHNVLDEYDENYLYNLKALIMLHDKYNFNGLLNKNGEYSFKRHDIDKDDIFKYGFCKACKLCNIRTKQQMIDLKASQTNRLHTIHVNLNTYLNPGNKIRKISKRELKNYEKKINVKFTFEHREEWVKKYGYLLNVYCKRSVPDFMKSIDLNENFDKYMIPTAYGFIDLFYGIILLDNINLSLIKHSVKSDNYGRIIIRSAKDNTFKTFVQTNIPNTQFNYWHKITDSGKELTRLYHNFGARTKYLSIMVKPGEVFTPTPTFKLPNKIKRNKLYEVKNLKYETI